MRGRPILYTPAELAWIAARAHMPRRQLHAAFVTRFGRDDVSLSHLKALCTRKGWSTGRSGRFEKGRTPANKGRTMPFNANSARTQFKTGHRGGRAEALYKPVGSERLSRDGYLERKIHDGLPLQSRWRAVHLIRWEEVNGPIPESHCLKCLDGDRANTEPSNWVVLPRALLPRLSGRWSLGYDEAAPEVRPALLAIAKLEHALRQARKAKG